MRDGLIYEQKLASSFAAFNGEAKRRLLNKNLTSFDQFCSEIWTLCHIDCGTIWKRFSELLEHFSNVRKL